MSAETVPVETLQRFVDHAAQSGGAAVSLDDLTGDATRAELGIGSLDMLILLAGYVDAVSGGRVALQPEWVPMLDDVEGIRSVLAEIDRMSAA